MCFPECPSLPGLIGSLVNYLIRIGGLLGLFPRLIQGADVLRVSMSTVIDFEAQHVLCDALLLSF